LGKGDSRPGRTLLSLGDDCASPEFHLQRTSFCSSGRSHPPSQNRQPLQTALATTKRFHVLFLFRLQSLVRVATLSSFALCLSNERAMLVRRFSSWQQGLRVCQECDRPRWRGTHWAGLSQSRGKDHRALRMCRWHSCCCVR